MKIAIIAISDQDESALITIEAAETDGVMAVQGDGDVAQEALHNIVQMLYGDVTKAVVNGVDVTDTLDDDNDAEDKEIESLIAALAGVRI